MTKNPVNITKEMSFEVKELTRKLQHAAFGDIIKGLILSSVSANANVERQGPFKTQNESTQNERQGLGAGCGASPNVGVLPHPATQNKPVFDGIAPDAPEGKTQVANDLSSDQVQENSDKVSEKALQLSPGQKLENTPQKRAEAQLQQQPSLSASPTNTPQ